MKLHHLTKGLVLLEKKHWNPSLEISSVTSNSRLASPGSLFVACPGPKTDGHLYFDDAFRKGARVWIGERFPSGESIPEPVVFLRVRDTRETLATLLKEFYGFSQKKLRLIGITGTNGKTTIAYLFNDLLNTQIPAGYIGTLGYRSPHQQGLLSNTTPGPEELFSVLGEMAKEGVRAVALEVSSHALDQKRVFGFNFDLAVFTQLTPEHLDYHQNLENYFQSKRLLFARKPQPKRILINRDAPYGRRLLTEFPKAKSFSLKEDADYRAKEISASFEGSEFIFESRRGKVKFHTRLPMIHNVENVTSVLAGLDLLGYDPKKFRGALESFPGVPGRLERIEGNGFTVFVDYAHTPDAFEHVLSEAKRLGPRRVLTLFGCGGDRDRFKRPEMTRIAYHYSDFVILTSDNPRTEDPNEIIRQMRQGLPEVCPHVLEITDRRDAIGEILGLAEPGDIVFILGKGHEDYQVIGTQKNHFDDREIVRDFLKRRSRVAI